jgi:hypothetical protein
MFARARLGLARCRARAAAAAGPADFGPPPRRRHPSSVADWRSQPPEPPQQLPQRRGAGAWACPSGQPAAAASRLHVFLPCSVLVWGRPGGAPPSPPARLKPPRAASHHIIYRPAQELLQETRVSQQVQTQFVHTHTHTRYTDTHTRYTATGCKLNTTPDRASVGRLLELVIYFWSTRSRHISSPLLPPRLPLKRLLATHHARPMRWQERAD